MEAGKTKDNLCFVAVAGMKRVYEPRTGTAETAKKHPCRDCHFCQFCSDSRCHSCRGQKHRPNQCSYQNLSLAEQVLLYERINAQAQTGRDQDSHDKENQ